LRAKLSTKTAVEPPLETHRNTYMAVKKKYSTLGRGLDALIATDEVRTSGSSSIGEIPVSQIMPNPNQPRRDFNEQALEELALSIKELGIVQPVTLRNMGDGTYQIIAGERRWRAAQKAGLDTLPAYIRTADDESTMQMALVENLQREDLNPIEIALAYQGLIEQYGLKQEELSEKVGKKRATVTNYLRLLKLPAQVQMALKNKVIDQGHARALLGLPSAATQLRVFEEIKSQGLSVRKVEDMVNRLNSGEDVNDAGKRIRARRPKTGGEEYSAMQKQLSEHFGAKVKMTCSPEGKGKITIPFRNKEDMERIIALFDKGK
jgi:ParB family transcriptional regulator, chromosome partitioning protein